MMLIKGKTLKLFLMIAIVANFVAIIWTPVDAVDIHPQKNSEPNILINSTRSEYIDIVIEIPASPFSRPQSDSREALFNETLYSHPTVVGVPDLPVLRRIIEVPYGSEISLEVIDSQYQMTSISALGFPEGFPLREPEEGKCNKPETDETTSPSGETRMQTAGFFPENVAQLLDTFVVRGRRIAQFEFWPVQYDPATGEVRLYSEVTLRLFTSGANLRLTASNAARVASPTFNHLLSAQVLNFNQGEASTSLREDKREGFLIIAPDAFLGTLSSFASFKESTGFTVTLVGLSATGTTADSIKNYIQNAYDNWVTPPSYILLVGDVNNGSNTLPAFSGLATRQSVTDLYYGTVDGSDWIPDIFVGRIPARDIPQLQSMLNNITAYYYLSGNETWVKKAALLASDDSSNWHVAEGTQNYVIQTHTTPNNYTGIFPTTPQPGGDKLYAYTYGADNQDVIAAINDGRSIVAYSGHGSRNSWGGPVYTQSNILNISASGVFPVVTSFACITGDFGITEAFGETWVLQADKGAIAFIGASDSSYWGPDDIMERAMMDSLFSGIEGANITGSFFHAGLLGVEAGFPGTGIGQSQYYWESYNLLGDPSLEVVTGPKQPDFSMNAQPGQLAMCQNGSDTTTITINPINAFNEAVTLSLTGVPDDVDPVFSNNPLFPGENSLLTLTANANAAPGSYMMTLAGTASSISHTLNLDLSLYNSQPSQTTLISPANYAASVPTTPTFQWEALNNSQTYAIQIAEDPEFNTIVISQDQLQQPQFIPQNALSTNTTYYWRVRGDNPCGSGVYTQTFVFTTMASPGDCPVNTSTNILYQTDFENNPAEWAHSGVNDTWTWQLNRAHSPSYAYSSADIETTSLQYLISPAIALPDSDESPLALKFWQWFDIEESALGCYDGALLEISTDNGINWQQIPNTALVNNPYKGTISTSYTNPLGGSMAWCGGQDWTETIVDLNAYAGQTIQLRFTLATDESIGQEGWYVDDFQVQSCQVIPPYQPSLTPEEIQHAQMPGENALIQVTLKNTGLNTDEYTLNLSSSKWQADLITKVTVQLAPGEATTIDIAVSIPPEAKFGETSEIILTATSNLDPDNPPAEASATIILMAGYRHFLPLLSR
jgi:hypothetical protein